MLNPLSSFEAWAVVLGIILVGIALAYGFARARRTTPREAVEREVATRELYEREDKEPPP